MLVEYIELKTPKLEIMEPLLTMHFPITFQTVCNSMPQRKVTFIPVGT